MLTWNGLEDTLACLASLEASAWPDLDLIVADNGSTDGTETAVRERHPAVSVIQNGRNVGFAAGNNAGIRLALARGADAFLVLNNDTWVPADAVERLVHALEADPFAGACSPVLSYAADPECLWFAGAPFDPARARAGRASSYERGSQLPDSPIAIDRAVGAAMLVRAEVAAAVGLFAEELFFLYEDVEWSLRMRAAGWRVLLVPDARLAHAVPRARAARHTHRRRRITVPATIWKWDDGTADSPACVRFEESCCASRCTCMAHDGRRPPCGRAISLKSFVGGATIARGAWVPGARDTPVARRMVGSGGAGVAGRLLDGRSRARRRQGPHKRGCARPARSGLPRTA